MPGPKERLGWGAIGFLIHLDGKSILNLGDTLLHAKDWETIHSPDVLMIPIGRKSIHNTMDVKEAIQGSKNYAPQTRDPLSLQLPRILHQAI